MGTKRLRSAGLLALGLAIGGSAAPLIGLGQAQAGGTKTYTYYCVGEGNFFDHTYRMFNISSKPATVFMSGSGITGESEQTIAAGTVFDQFLTNGTAFKVRSNRKLLVEGRAHILSEVNHHVIVPTRCT